MTLTATGDPQQLAVVAETFTPNFAAFEYRIDSGAWQDLPSGAGDAHATNGGTWLELPGLAGNGQDELLAALSGELRSAPDSIKLKGQPIGRLGPNARRQLGLLTAPEERLGHAAAPDMSLTEN